MGSGIDSSKNIMVVEDDAAMQELIREFLERQGHRVSLFRSAIKALEAVRAFAPGERPPVELIISDINMPQMDGFEFLKLAREAVPSVPIILITAFGNRVTEKEALKEGAVAYLNKPFGLGELNRLIITHAKASA
ncbi:MAG: response regulator [Bdellovibrionales bacterium]|nr:response regulator [Bdellovibrionales bacterium]